MKKIITTIFASAMSMAAFAQPAAGLVTNFEAAFGGNTNPAGWVSANVLVPNVVTQDTNGYGAGSAAKITTTDLSTNPFIPAAIPHYSGILLAGTISLAGLTQGTVYNARPAGIAFWYKYVPVANDSALMLLSLSKKNTSTMAIDILGGTYFHTSTQATWTKATLPLSYNAGFATIMPDTLKLIFSSSTYTATAANVGSVFTIDEIILYPVGTSSVNEIKNDAVFIYPNPSQEKLFVKRSNNDVATVLIIDISGKIVLSENISLAQTEINLQAIANGFYTLVCTDKSGNAISRNKFEVIK